jgi:hypothetical protein
MHISSVFRGNIIYFELTDPMNNLMKKSFNLRYQKNFKKEREEKKR